MSLTRPAAPDLVAARAQVADRTAPALRQLAAAAEAAAGSPHVYLRRFDAQAHAAAADADARVAAGAPLPPLAGLAVSVKDLFDVAGFPTTAGSAALHDAAPAAQDCPAVARLAPPSWVTPTCRSSRSRVWG